MEQTKVSASIVLYGDLEKARRCMESLLAQTQGVSLELYVVDNHSPDHAGEILKKEFSHKAHFILLPENIGFGAAHNLAIRRAKSRYHAVINPDIELTEDSLTALCSYLDAHPDVVMTTPRLYFPDGRDQFVAKRRPNLLALLARQAHFSCLQKYEDYYLMQDRDLSCEQDIQFCTGCFFVARTRTLWEIGGFDRKYFLYVEDADLTQKALKKGRVTYSPCTCVIHAWNRKPSRNGKHFAMQMKSMLRYFCKWGFQFGFRQHI